MTLGSIYYILTQISFVQDWVLGRLCQLTSRPAPVGCLIESASTAPPATRRSPGRRGGTTVAAVARSDPTYTAIRYTYIHPSDICITPSVIKLYIISTSKLYLIFVLWIVCAYTCTWEKSLYFTHMGNHNYVVYSCFTLVIFLCCNRWCVDVVHLTLSHCLTTQLLTRGGGGVEGREGRWWGCAPRATYASWEWPPVPRQQTTPTPQLVPWKYCRSQESIKFGRTQRKCLYYIYSTWVYTQEYDLYICTQQTVTLHV